MNISISAAYNSEERSTKRRMKTVLKEIQLRATIKVLHQLLVREMQKDAKERTEKLEQRNN